MVKASPDSVGFTPNPDCGNCGGSGLFCPADNEPCAFCLEDAILSGEIDGSIDGVEYEKGQPISLTRNP